MARESLVCSTCGTVGQPKTNTPGSFVIELFLWLCMLLPGLLYSIWRLTARKQVCSACGAAALVPVSSPVGRRLTGAA